MKHPEPSRDTRRLGRIANSGDALMQVQADVASKSQGATPSLLLAFLGFATSTVGIVGIMTALGTLA